MVTIISNHQFTLSTNVQQAINNAAANIGGIDTVVVGRTHDTDDGQQYEIYDEEDNFLFRVDSDGIVSE